MSKPMTQQKQNIKSRGGGFLPSLCHLLGTLILLSVICICIPVSAPRLFGYEIFHVVSGSMEPEIPIGSAVYVKATAPEEIQKDDVIAFLSGESVITHRVVRNKSVEGEFVTKGDANAKADREPVSYEALIGRVVLHLPVLGDFMAVLTSMAGKAYMVCFAACGAMFHMLAGRIRRRRLEESEGNENNLK